jgi:hypothetical protein
LVGAISNVSGIAMDNIPEPGTTSSAGQDATVRASDKCVTRKIAGETLVIPIAGGVADLEAIYTLNEVGSRIWALISSAVPVRQVVDALVTEYDVPREEAAGDVAQFLDALRSARLLA